MTNPLPAYPSSSGPAAAGRLRGRLARLDGLIVSLEQAREHLDATFTVGLEAADKRANTQERLRRLAGGR